MTLDFNPDGAVEVSMKGYIKQLLIDYNSKNSLQALLQTPYLTNLMIKYYSQNLKTLDSILA
jgi:hypothetical protein